MSYAEHGSRIFLVGKSSCGAPLTYGDYVLPRKRLEGRLKLYNSCTDIRAWSPNITESSRYFRELNEHDPAVRFPYNFLANPSYLFREIFAFCIFSHNYFYFYTIFIHKLDATINRLKYFCTSNLEIRIDYGKKVTESDSSTYQILHYSLRVSSCTLPFIE